MNNVHRAVVLFMLFAMGGSDASSLAFDRAVAHPYHHRCSLISTEPGATTRLYLHRLIVAVVRLSALQWMLGRRLNPLLVPDMVARPTPAII